MKELFCPEAEYFRTLSYAFTFYTPVNTLKGTKSHTDLKKPNHHENARILPKVYIIALKKTRMASLLLLPTEKFPTDKNLSPIPRIKA